MKKINIKSIILLPILFAYTFSIAQMKIKDGTVVGTSNSPNANAILELESNNKGFLPPQIALTNTSTPALGSVAGMVIYNTATSGSGSAAVTPGFYYNNGTIWIRLNDATSEGWSLTGNSGTTPGTGVGQNFMGTTDNEDVVFARNGVQSGLLNNNLFNTSWGVGALNPFTTGAWNVADGYQALSSNTTGSANVADGYQALNSNIAGSSNVGVGNQALYLSTNAIGYNTAVGDYALGSNITGYYNTAIGAQAEVNNGLTNSTSVGYNATATSSDQVMLGNTSVISVMAAGTFTIYSDGRFKKNIKQNVPGLSFINQLRPVTYNYDIHGLNKHLKLAHDTINSQAQSLMETNINNKEKIIYTGFVAQDVETVVNKIGYDFSGLHKPQNDQDAYGLSYSDFVPSLVKSVQELSTQNDSLKSALVQQQDINNNTQQQLNDLKTTISQMQTAMSQCCNNYSASMTTTAKPALVTGTDVATLQQNVPNPYNGSTVIGYHLPQSTTNAQIIVSDVNGNVLKSIALNGNGNGQITFNAGSFASGSYFYTLLVNGQKVDTKEMIVAN